MKVEALLVAPRENPLVPFALMKRIYTGMVETRLLEAWLAKRRGEGKRSPVEGEEACRAAVLLGLKTDDWVSDVAEGASAAWLRGMELPALTDLKAGRSSQPGILPHCKNTSERLAMGVGTALALKRCKQPGVAVVFVHEGMKASVWRRTLRPAVVEELPMLFVALPAADKKAVDETISVKATRFGVPGIPVDASDAVALYRVAQECLLRARAGGGPALMECVRLRRGNQDAPDPIDAMARMLLRTGACDQAWLDDIAPSFRARLKAMRHERPRVKQPHDGVAADGPGT